MNISGERLEQFRKLYVEEFKEEISKDDARIMSLRLIELYRLFMQLEARSDPPAQNDREVA